MYFWTCMGINREVCGFCRPIMWVYSNDAICVLMWPLLVDLHQCVPSSTINRFFILTISSTPHSNVSPPHSQSLGSLIIQYWHRHLTGHGSSTSSSVHVSVLYHGRTQLRSSESSLYLNISGSVSLLIDAYLLIHLSTYRPTDLLNYRPISSTRTRAKATALTSSASWLSNLWGHSFYSVHVCVLKCLPVSLLRLHRLRSNI